MIDFKVEVAKTIALNSAVVDAGLTENEILELIEKPTDADKGDYAFPCFKLAKAFRKAPPLIAEEIATALIEQQGAIEGDNLFEKIENVSGYVNFFINRIVLCSETIKEVLKKGDAYGSSDEGQGKKVLVEYSSPNIAKPFHIGHIRSTVIGNSIGNILSFLGYDVERLNHLGDYGTQFGKLIVAYRMFGNKEEIIASPISTLLKYYVEFHERAEEDPSLENDARAAFAALEQGSEEEVELWKWFREESLREFTTVYDMLGIEFDSYDGESFFSDKMDRVTDELESKGLLEESEGAMIVDLEEEDLGKALIKKSDGSTLYITRDIAAAIYRKEHYDFEKNIYVVASQQDLHFKQWFKIVEKLGYDWAKDCVHVQFGLVHLQDGVISTRTGNVVFLEDVLNNAIEKTKIIIDEKGVNTDNVELASKQIGIGAVVFQELHNNRIKDYTFSWEKVLNFDGETGPFVQYNYARTSSLLKKAAEDAEKIDALFTTDEGILSGAKYIVSDAAYALEKLIYELPQVISEAGARYEPSIITRHVVDIAQAFSTYYVVEHILVENEDERRAKLALVKAARYAISNALSLLGIEKPERM